jgi:hypothetical protein
VRDYIRQLGTEQRQGRPAQRAGGVEHGPGRLVEAGEVDPGEFGDDGGDRGVGDREVGAGAPRGGGEPQCQRVSVGDPAWRESRPGKAFPQERMFWARREPGAGRSPAGQASCWDRYYSAKSQVFRG